MNWFGPADFTTIAADFDTAMQDGMYAPGGFLAKFAFGSATTLSIKDDPAAAAAADPSSYVSPSSPPFAILHGTADHFVSPSQTLALHNAIQAKGGKSVRYAVQGGNHSDLSFTTGDPNASGQWSSEQLMGKIVTFLTENLR